MELFVQYGLLGIVLASLGAGLYRLGVWTLKHIAQPIAQHHIEFLKEAILVMQEMRKDLPLLTEVAREIQMFRRESKDPEMPYSAIKAERAVIVLGEMLLELAPADRETELSRLLQRLEQTVRR